MQSLEKILAQKTAPKAPEWPSYGNLGKVTQNPHFLKKCKGGTKKVAFVWNAQKHSGGNGIIPELVWTVPEEPEWQSYFYFGKVTLNPHFLKKWKGGTKENFSKIAQKVAFVWKAQKHSGASWITL